VGYLCANFSLPRPLSSHVRPNVRDRQTDRRQTKALLNASALWALYCAPSLMKDKVAHSVCLRVTDAGPDVDSGGEFGGARRKSPHPCLGVGRHTRCVVDLASQNSQHRRQYRLPAGGPPLSAPCGLRG